jgi:hypothetical protein
MAQQNIDYGSFPNDPSADAIRIAFEKVQNNFTELYGNLSNITGNVSRITAGTGIIASNPTGNVTIDSVFSSLTVHSDTVSITGIGGFVPTGGVAGEDYTINNSTNILFIELDPATSPVFTDLTLTGNLTIDGTTIQSTDANIELTNGNITLVTGQLVGNILSSAGANTVQFADSNGIITGDTNFIYDLANTNLTLTGGNIFTDTVSAGYLINTVNLNISNVANITNTATVGQLVSTGNVSGTNGILSGNLTVTGNVGVDSVLATGSIVAASLSGNGFGLFDLVASNVTTGTLPPSVLSGNYNINIIGSADSATNVTGNQQPNINSVGTLVDLTVTGTTIVGNLTSLGNIFGETANIAGNTSVGNLTVFGSTSGNTAIFSGTVDVGNLQTTGNLTSSNIINSGTISTDSLAATGNIEAGNLTVTSEFRSGSLTVTGNSAVANLTGENFTIGNLTATGIVTAIETVVNQSTVSANILAGNVYANSGTIGGQNGIFLGQLSSVNGLFSGNVTSGNITNSDTISTLNLTVTGNIDSASMTNIGTITTEDIVANAVVTNIADITALTVTDTAQIEILKLSNRTVDPSPATGGEVYYNSVTGKFRVYNGVLGEWQNLN